MGLTNRLRNRRKRQKKSELRADFRISGGISFLCFFRRYLAENEDKKGERGKINLKKTGPCQFPPAPCLRQEHFFTLSATEQMGRYTFFLLELPCKENRIRPSAARCDCLDIVIADREKFFCFLNSESDKIFLRRMTDKSLENIMESGFR